MLLWLDALLPWGCMACRVLCWKSCRGLWLWLVLTVLTGQLPAIQVLLLPAVLLCNGLRIRMGVGAVCACVKMFQRLLLPAFFLGACP